MFNMVVQVVEAPLLSSTCPYTDAYVCYPSSFTSLHPCSRTWNKTGTDVVTAYLAAISLSGHFRRALVHRLRMDWSSTPY